MMVKCIKCGLRYNVEDSVEGQSMECECGEVFIIESTRSQLTDRVSSLRVPTQEKTKYQAKNHEEIEKQNQFKSPMLSMILSIIGALVFVGGILIITQGWNKNGVTVISGVSILACSSVWFALGSIVGYLAEIAYNTKK